MDTNYSLIGTCSVYAKHLGGTWYGLLSSLSGKENILSKQPMPENTSLNSL